MERRLRLEEKLDLAVPLATGRPSIKGRSEIWTRFKRLSDLRNEVVHLKERGRTNDPGLPGYTPPGAWSRLWGQDRPSDGPPPSLALLGVGGSERVCISTTNPVCSSRAEVRGLPDEDSGAVADDHTLAEDHYARITVELVLRSSGSGDDVWLHNQRLCIGDLIQAGSGSWRVIAEEPPTHVGIHARYICSGA
jgi:hypothetical protein